MILLKSSAAFAFFLLMLVTGCLLIQSAGHWLNIDLVSSALWVALLPCLWLSYGYYFPYTRAHGVIAALLTLLLVLLGRHCLHTFDFSADGLGYQQAAAEDLLNGWNPVTKDSTSLWQNIYPSGAWMVEASIARFYGSLETTRMLQFWWLIIALPLTLYGFYRHSPTLHPLQGILVVLCVLSTTVIVQILTHYVDSLTYLSGMTFLAGLLIYDKEKHMRQLGLIIMCSALLFIVNDKLTGIYHATMLCSAALIVTWFRTRKLPWQMALVFAGAGAVALLLIGWRPYVTNLFNYGVLLPVYPDTPESFSGAQRPSSFDGLSGPARFFYSLISATEGLPHQPVIIKWPWTIDTTEIEFSGIPDARAAGYGPFFLLGFLFSLVLLVYARLRAIPMQRDLLILALVCLLFSACFPQSWWMRYVPFGYAVPFFIACAITPHTSHIRAGLCVLILCFSINITIVGHSAYALFIKDQHHFAQMVDTLKESGNAVYLVPPAASYERYNHAYMPLQRRLLANGIETSVRVSPNAPCPHMAEMYAEFKVCY